MCSSPDYTGCPSCNDAMAALLRMNGQQYCDWLTRTQRSLRTASGATLRTIIRHYQEDTMNNYTPPDPYAAPLAALRAANTTDPLCAFEDQFRANRLREMNEMRALLDAEQQAQPHVATAAALGRGYATDGRRSAASSLSSERPPHTNGHGLLDLVPNQQLSAFPRSCE